MLRELLIVVTLTVIAAIALLAVPLHAEDSQSPNMTRHVDDIEWIKGTEGVYFGVLWGDWEKGPFGMIVKIEAGHSIPTHAHTDDYDGITIQGNWGHIFGDSEDVVLPPGSYAKQVKGDFHSDYCTGPDDCLVLIHQHGPRSFIEPVQ